ncbi:hypothetical protein V2J09_000926 [Rumex salicifolius]
MTDQGSELVARILEYIGSSALKEISRISGVREELERIEETLIAIHALMLDLQDQQSISKSMRNWLQNLKSVAYDIEDVLDLITTQDLELKVNGRSLIRKITRLFTNYDVARELKVIRHKLDEIEYNHDVWIRDPKQWIELKELLAIGSPRSRVILTTRDERVGSITGTMESYRVKGLSNDDCWSIFAKYAFNKCEYKVFPLLVEIGKSIVQKCKGVPLAAKTLGSVLHGERDDRTWKRIEESELWKIEQGPDDILPALKLSYDQIPYHLRSCFALCAFKKGYPLFRIHLINTWMALGLLQSRDGGEDVEAMGDKYKKDIGDDWNLISHIPEIRMDHEVIQTKAPHTQLGDQPLET